MGKRVALLLSYGKKKTEGNLAYRRGQGQSVICHKGWQ